jgi:hypothetical protein
MSTNIEYLTHKHIEETSRRVYYTLTADRSIDIHRTAKILGFRIEHLNDRGILSRADIDEILTEVVKLAALSLVGLSRHCNA